MIKEESTVKLPAEDQMDWQRVGELLQTTEYEQVARLLHQAQLAAVRKGQTAEADILALLGCVWGGISQTRSERSWHQQACAQAGRREQELKQQLLAILALFNQSDPPKHRPKPASLPARSVPKGVSPRGDTPEPGPDTGLSGRVVSLLDQNVNARALKGLLLTRPTVTNGSLPPALPKAIEPEQAEPGSATLAIHCLGPFRVSVNGQPVTRWKSLKSQAILKYLAAHHGSYTGKDLLMDLFWPEAGPKAAAHNLHQAIHGLRQTLKRGQTEVQFILYENDCYFLNPDVTLWLDSAEFERLERAGRRLEAAGQQAAAMAEYSQAEALYQGDFLEENLYDEWASWPREHLRHTYLELADRLSENYVEQGQSETAIALCQKILRRDNCYEQAHRCLMVCYHKQGHRHLIIRQYQLCEQKLKTELDVPPSPETQALYKKLIGGTRGLKPA